MTPNFVRALAVLAEALIEGRRVLVVADSSLGLHTTLAELGARLVHVYDPDAERAMTQPPPTERGHVLRGLPEGDFEVRDGAFDLAFVPDLTITPDPAALLARLRRVVGNEGAVLCAASNKDATQAEQGLDYYELYDLVSMQFANIRMLAIMPFVGVTAAELGQDEVETAVRVDTQLAGEREAPSVFVALASQEDVALDAYAVIELPADGEAQAGAEADAAVLAELTSARLRVEVLQSRIEELAAHGQKEARASEELRRVLEALDAERERGALLERELDRERLTRAADQSAEHLAAARQRIALLEEGVQLAEQTIIALRDRLAQVESAFEQADEERAALRGELEQRGAARASGDEVRALEVRAAELEAELALAQEAHAEDHAALEATLRERGEAVAALSAEVSRRERIVRELLVAIEARGDAAQPAATELAEEPAEESLRAKLDELARLAAAQESELQARAWRIGELERALDAAPPPLAGETAEVDRLRDEIFALRQALTQEHAEKQRIADDARAELQRQAVLIEQLSGRADREHDSA